MNGARAVVIYGLACPIESKVMYVGKALNEVVRLRQHIYNAKRECTSRKDKWLRHLDQLGLSPSLVIIDRCTEVDCSERERQWIKHYRSVNPELTNIKDGGSGWQATSRKSTKKNHFSIRLDKMTVDDVHHLATEVYKFKNTSEFMRHVFEYIEKNRPVLRRVIVAKSRV